MVVIWKEPDWRKCDWRRRRSQRLPHGWMHGSEWLWCRTRGCMGASGFGVAPVDGIIMNVLVVEIEITYVTF